MSTKLIKCLLLCLVLAVCHSAMAQAADSTRAGDLKAKIAAVNARIEAISKENKDIKTRLSDTQKQIDQLKQLSAQKDKEIKALEEKAKAAGKE